MRAFIFLFALFAPFIHAAQFPVEDGVLVLSDSNFEDAIADHKQILVEFYAPWCGHCKSLAPEYAKAAKALADAPVKLAKVDATENKDLASQFDIRGFPTLKYFKNGKPSDYNGGRTEGEIVSWLSKKIGPPAVTVTSEEQLLQLQESHEVVVLGVFASADSEAAKAFLSAAADDELHFYAISHDSSVQQKLGVTGDSVVVLKSFDDLRADYTFSADSTASDVQQFALANSSPLIQEFSQESSKKIFSSQVQKHFLFFTNKASEHHASTIATFREVAAAYKGQALFVNVPTSEQRILDFFEIKATDVPAAILADLGNESGMKKYPFTGEYTVDSLKSFVQDFFDGKLKPHLKTEEVSADDTTGDVVVLRGKSFKDIVLDNDKDVLVEFYAPWCGHCKKLAPTWEELGQHFKSNSNVVIAKIDSTANEIDVPGVAVRGFPTIYFFKGNDKTNPVRYEGGRELNDLLEYLEENAHHAVSRDEL